MSKLPNITNPVTLEKIIQQQIGVMQFDEKLRLLILENVSKMEESVRRRLEELLHGANMNQND